MFSTNFPNIPKVSRKSSFIYIETILDTHRDNIRKWMLENLSLGTVGVYSVALCRVVESMNVSQSKKDDIKRFYLDISSEIQRLKYRKKTK